MRIKFVRFSALAGARLFTLALAMPAQAAEDTAADAADAFPGDAEAVIVVTGKARSYTNSATTEPMILQQTPLTSPLSMIDNLPGVSVNEGDTFGFDDWSTTVAVRGFQTNLDEQQVGITIDGLPNGGSGYGGGSKANRYIDTMNIGAVEVSQGTADIGSLSNEALGGTLNFTTSDPLDERRMRFSVSLGEFDAQRYYARYDTGDLGGISAWISATHQEATDWVNGAADNKRDHLAAKVVADLGGVRLSGYASYDDAHENNYDNVYSAEQFELAPDTDGLTSEWTGIPFIDQVYRPVWGTLRENGFAYLKAEATLAEGIELHTAGYYHKMGGRGDWAPPYVVDLISDGSGSETELQGGTVYGGSSVGQIFFVDANGVALSPIDGCESTLTFPYGGTSNAAYDPSCYAAGAVAVQSYRHTHYRKERYGGTADLTWQADLGQIENELRGGIWYEDGKRREWRDWHLVTDTRVGPAYSETPYWVQYSREYPQSTFKWYLQEQATLGPVTATAGIKQFVNTLDRVDLFGQSESVRLKSTSKVLFSGGLQFRPMTGVELFGGYAQNFKALTDAILETTGADFDNLEPETAENFEVGARYNLGGVMASATYFNSKFKNRVVFVSAATGAGPDYLVEGDGGYFNAGGVDADGFELLLAAEPITGLSLYASYTHTDATYRGSGDEAVDDSQGIVPGNKVTGIPEDMFALSASWNSGPYRAGISGKYTGDRFVDRANTWVAKSYVNVDAYIGVRGEAVSEAFKALDLSLNINNAFDESYLGGISGNAAWIGAPRTIVFTLTADF